MNLYPCPKCDKEFKTNQGLDRHLNAKTPCTERKSLYICETCGYSTKDKTKYNRHKNNVRSCKPSDQNILTTENIINLTNRLTDVEKKLGQRKKSQKSTPNTSGGGPDNGKPNEEPDNSGFIYIIQEREFLNLNYPLYKIGRTQKTINKRLAGYPNNSVVLFTIHVKDCIEIEKELIDLFNNKFEHAKEIGKEYFIGNLDEMTAEIVKTIYGI